MSGAYQARSGTNGGVNRRSPKSLILLDLVLDCLACQEGFEPPTCGLEVRNRGFVSPVVTVINASRLRVLPVSAAFAPTVLPVIEAAQ